LNHKIVRGYIVLWKISPVSHLSIPLDLLSLLLALTCSLPHRRRSGDPKPHGHLRPPVRQRAGWRQAPCSRRRAAPCRAEEHGAGRRAPGGARTAAPRRSLWPAWWTDGRTSCRRAEKGTYSSLPPRSSCHRRNWAPNRRSPHRIERHRRRVAACCSTGDELSHHPVQHLISLANRNKPHIDDILITVVHALKSFLRTPCWHAPTLRRASLAIKATLKDMFGWRAEWNGSILYFWSEMTPISIWLEEWSHSILCLIWRTESFGWRTRMGICFWSPTSLFWWVYHQCSTITHI